MTNTQTGSDDPYLEQMLGDLRRAEYTLLADISNEHNPFRTDGTNRLKQTQANVDRLHAPIRTYKANPQAGNGGESV